MTEEELRIYVIYRHPKDYPLHFVVRAQVLNNKGELKFESPILCQTLNEARAKVPTYLSRFYREEQDDPVIVESYI